MVGAPLGLAALATVAEGRTLDLLSGRQRNVASGAEALAPGYFLVVSVSTPLLLLTTAAAKMLPEPTDREAEPKDLATKGTTNNEGLANTQVRSAGGTGGRGTAGAVTE